MRPDEQAASTVSFIEEAVAFFAGQGVRVERVMTDIQTRWAFASHAVGRLWKDARVRLPSAIAELTERSARRLLAC